MRPLEWSEEYSVDIPGLDAQHRQLIELLGDLLKSTRSGKSSSAPIAFNKAIQYADQHLRWEELLLRMRGYPGYAEHKKEHDAYREKVASLQARADRRDFAVRLANFLTEWWRFHILTSDQQYARFFRSRPK
jgi:hemerythrin-like metal-binding protein